MSQVDTAPVQPATSITININSASDDLRSEHPFHDKNQTVGAQKRGGQDGTEKTSKQGFKGAKGTKPKGPKGGTSTQQPYYQELIMQLTNATEWSPCDAPKKAAEPIPSLGNDFGSLRGRLHPGSVITTTSTTTTTTTTTQRTSLAVPDARPRPSRSLSSRSARSFRSAKSFLSARSSTESLASSTDKPSSTEYSPGSSSITLTPMPATTPLTTKTPRVPTKTKTGRVLSLAEVQDEPALHSLLSSFGGVQHGGILDPNYSFFLNASNSAMINFIIKDRVAVVGGDPLCSPERFDNVLADFGHYRKRHRLGVAIFGGSDQMLEYGKAQGWSSIRFGQERVLNPLTNPVLQGKVQKQIIRQNKALLDPQRGGNSVHIYTPATSGRDGPLEGALRGVYEAWKHAKSQNGKPQRYTTVYDPFALPDLMVYVYTRSRDGTPNGFAALRRLGSKCGYYIDPCVAAPGAPSRIPDLLYFTSMGLLNMLGCNYLAIGMEPTDSLELHGFPGKLGEYAKKAHNCLYASLKLGGKKEYHAKFRPDDELGSSLYLQFPGDGGCPGPRRIMSVVHFANISLREVARERWQKMQEKRRSQGAPAKNEAGQGNRTGSDALTGFDAP